MKLLDQIYITSEFLQKRGIREPHVGIVLGTGLHQLCNHVNIITTIQYSDIPHFPVSTVEFHRGSLIYGTLGNKNIMMMQGRFHAYEGYSMQDIVFPIRVMKTMGIASLFLSNAAGGINLIYKKGDLVLIDDHINLQYGNPLSGENTDKLGPRFPDMSEPYDVQLKALLQENAHRLDIKLQRGVYAAVQGPNLETRAEYRYLKVIGADLVGMSTVPEVIAANHMQLPCAAISVVTDECNPDNLRPINIAEIIAVAGEADKKLSQLLANTITALS